MYNDFVLIGPASDPAGIKGKPITEAIATIAAKGQPLVSRADKSGTHMAELRLFKAGVKDYDKASWYVRPDGMLNTINIVDERKGYALADEVRSLNMKQNQRKPGLIVVEGVSSSERVLGNGCQPDQTSACKYDLAIKYIDYPPQVQKDIANFKLEGKQPSSQRRYRAGH